MASIELDLGDGSDEQPARVDGAGFGSIRQQVRRLMTQED